MLIFLRQFNQIQIINNHVISLKYPPNLPKFLTQPFHIKNLALFLVFFNRQLY